MTLHIRAHFDGRVIVPDEAVHLPINQALSVQLYLVDDPAHEVTSSRLAAYHRLVSRGVKGLSIRSESLSRENLYDGD